ncbi:TetR/AcrR family transcriptional regulator [Paenibacillus sp. TRM 82003]|nr:TetR/AcrR family transcriptional regulator [Paenibacillus sp. TRM 82003]
MPPKAVITEEKIVNAAFEIVRETGWASLAARKIAQKLKCSTQPIYSAIGNMEEIKERTYLLAANYSRDKILSSVGQEPSAALNLAIGFLIFAKEERHLFHLLYLSGYKTFDLEKESFLGEALVMQAMRMSNRVATLEEGRHRSLYLQLMIYLIGIGSMLYSRTLRLDIHEAADMVREMYETLLARERSDRQ